MLQSCPKCGGTAEEHLRDERYIICCKKCGYTLSGIRKKAVRYRWNHHPVPPIPNWVFRELKRKGAVYVTDKTLQMFRRPLEDILIACEEFTGFAVNIRPTVLVKGYVIEKKKLERET